MKILFLTPWYPDEVQANHGIFIRDQVEALVAAGHQIVVISAKPDRKHFGILNARVTKTLENGVSVIRMRIPRSFPLYNQVNYYILCVRQALKVVQEFKPDILHGNIGYPGAVWTALVKLKTGIPAIFTEHTLLHNNFRTIVHRWLTLWALPKMNRVITVSHFASSIIKKHSGVDAVVIPNIVDFTLFNRIVTSPPFPPVSMGFLGGSFFQKKGLDSLIKALGNLSGDFLLHVGGYDPIFEPTIRRLIKENGLDERCIFHGFICRNEVPNFLSRVHFFVSASIFESFGVAVAEAMSLGLPVVITESGGPSDFTGPWSGISVPVGDVSALSYALSRMLIDFGKYDREKIRDSVIHRFRGDRIAQEIQTQYLQVLDKRATV